MILLPPQILITRKKAHQIQKKSLALTSSIPTFLWPQTPNRFDSIFMNSIAKKKYEKYKELERKVKNGAVA